MQRYVFSTLQRQILYSCRKPNPILSQHINGLQVQNDLQKSYYSQNSPSQRPGFFGNVWSNIKQEMGKNKEMGESLKKFREEAQKLEESAALKEARRKFENIESETSKGASQIKSQFAEKVKGTIEDLSKADAVKKAGEFTQNIGKKAGETAENIGKSNVFQSATSAATNIKEEIEGRTLGGRVYRPLVTLRKRKEGSVESEERSFEVNEEATGVELHKDSKFYASWQNFKDNNPVFNKFVDYRVKMDESDNPVVRGARVLTEKVQGLFGSMNTELSQVLTEIVKMDPNFCQEQFLKECERDIIPNILEAFIQGNLEILEDWCFEAPFSILSTPIRQAKELNYHFHSQILDIENVELAMGKMTEQGPVLAITFTSQMIECIKDAKGTVVQGDPEKVMRIDYIWVLCRDQAELDPKAAWRLMELAIRSANEQFL